MYSKKIKKRKHDAYILYGESLFKKIKRPIHKRFIGIEKRAEERKGGARR